MPIFTVAVSAAENKPAEREIVMSKNKYYTSKNGSEAKIPTNPLLFSSENGDFFGFYVSRYQFPDITADYYDSNWLVIAGKATIDGRQWQFDDPALLTFELATLAEWFEALSAGEHERLVQDFIEPVLSFEYQETGVLRIIFELEARPSWMSSDIAGQNDVYIDFKVTAEELGFAANTIRDMLIKFPQRGSR